jgi:hypothetical protein
MTTAILDQAAYERISAQAAQVRTGHTLLSVVASLFFFAGWLAGRVLPCLMWCGFAVREGFRAAHGPSRKMRIAMLTAQVEDLQLQLSRFSG